MAGLRAGVLGNLLGGNRKSSDQLILFAAVVSVRAVRGCIWHSGTDEANLFELACRLEQRSNS